ncbi:MAG TPA: GNAT family N-acetyltransferase [Gammaproteobacteria bacterium]|nr:GNAT family N-acetyltransferase [Gammaproteobacteria bacterium]
MSNNIKVVRAGIGDLDRVAPLFDGYRQFYNQPPDLPLARGFMAKRLERADSVIFIAIERSNDGEMPLGFVQLYPSFSSVHACPIWILNDLFVVPESRGLGIGRALMARAREHAIDTGAGQLFLETAPDNPAQKLYESLGYVCQNGTSKYYVLSLD